MQNDSQQQTVIKTKTKGFGFIKSCIGFLILGPFGLLCGLCGFGKSKTTIVRK